MSTDVSISKDWCISFDHYDPEDEGRREALLALGNGYLVSRAAASESVEDDFHYPGTYRVGCYNRLKTIIEGKEMENESLVNLPNWLLLTFRINKGQWFSLDEVEILTYRQVLDLQHAILYRQVQFLDQQDRKTILEERRFVSMAQPHLMGLELLLTAENWSGDLEVNSALDGSVVNNNVKRYAPYHKRRLEVLFTARVDKETIALKAKNLQSGIDIAFAARTRVHIAGRKAQVKREVDRQATRVTDMLQVSVQQGEQVVIEKVTSLYTSRDHVIAECGQAARQALQQASEFDLLLAAHNEAWKHLWHRCKMNMADKDQLRYFRIHMFQILQNMSPHSIDQDVGIPPSGWQGEEYHGQIFWDELFVFPFLLFRFPTVARASLLYRYRRLNKARQLAQQHGYKGAMFPWRSASTGREETPQYQWNMLSGHWMQDHTCLQHHIGAIIVYNVCHYVQISGDHIFLEEYGAELVLEIARFWASIARHNPVQDRFEIHDVVGPDEYHTKYPDATKPGLKNNAYTNIMAVWTLCHAQQVLEQLSPQRKQELCDMLALNQEELTLWDKVSRRMRIVFQENGTLSQFEEFEQLKKFDLREFRQQHGQERIDWSLEAMGDDIARYHVSKQADIALLPYLFSISELNNMLERLGYKADQHLYKSTLDEQIAHTAHESTLSHIVYAGAYANIDSKVSWKLFQKAQMVDLTPDEYKDTSEGIHLGAMGGTISVLQHHYLGFKVKYDVLEIYPMLPEAMKWVEITLYFRGVEINCHTSLSVIILHSVDKNAAPVKVRFKGQLKVLTPESPVTFDLRV